MERLIGYCVSMDVNIPQLILLAESEVRRMLKHKWHGTLMIPVVYSSIKALINAKIDLLRYS
jgi:hypothetical protein